MTVASTTPCPHCGAMNPLTAAFCESCGKALPGAQRSGPRVVGADEMPTTAVGHQLVGDELVKTQKSASTALLVVAIIQTVVGGILGLVLKANAPPAVQEQLTLLLVVQFAVAALFWGLWFWSRSAPLPATIVALVVYCTLVSLNVVQAMKQLSQDPNSGHGIGGIGIGWLDIVIIAILARAIGAGLKHKRLVAARVQAGV